MKSKVCVITASGKRVCGTRVSKASGAVAGRRNAKILNAALKAFRVGDWHGWTSLSAAMDEETRAAFEAAADGYYAEARRIMSREADVAGEDMVEWSEAYRNERFRAALAGVLARASRLQR